MRQISDIESVFNESLNRSYPKGQILFYQGERTDKIFRVLSGYVKVYDVTAEGEEKLLLILGEGDIFPVIWNFSKSEPLHYFYETLDDSQVGVSDRKEILSGIKKSHPLAIDFLEYMVDRSSELMMRIECIEASSAKHKVAQVLSYLASAHGDEVARCAFRVRITVTHQMIADMSGLNRSTVSSHMKELETEKVFKDTATAGMIIHTDRIETLLENTDD